MASTRVGRAIRTAGLLFALGGGAATWLYVQQVRPREALHEAQENEKRLFRFGRADVVSGVLHTRGATVAFERQSADRAFVLTSPVRWPGDPEALDALLDRMATIKLDPILTEAATDAQLTGWGLDAPPIRLDVRLRDGRALALLVGAKNTLVDAYPVTDAARRRVGLSDPAFHWAFDRPVSAFRSRRLVPVDPAQVARLEIRRREGPSLEIARKRGDGPWRLSAPGLEPRTANPRRARMLVVAFTRRLEALGYVTDAYDPEDAAEWALDPPAAEVTVTALDGRTWTLAFGAYRGTRAQEGSWIVHRSGTDTLAEVDGAIERELALSPTALVDRTLSRFDPETVTEVEMQLGTEAPFVLDKASGGWAIRGDTARPIKSWQVDAIVRTFALLEGDGTHAEAATPDQRRRWLLEPPSRRLVFRDGAGAILAAVRIGDRLDDAHLLAKTESDPRVFTLADKKLRALPGASEDLVDPTKVSGSKP